MVWAPAQPDFQQQLLCVRHVAVHMATNSELEVQGPGAVVIVVLYLMFVGCSLAKLQRYFPHLSGLREQQALVFTECCNMQHPLHLAPQSIAALHRQDFDASGAEIAVLALMSNVVGNVPVTKCAIVRGVQRNAHLFAGTAVPLTPYEIVLLAYCKVPCAMDALCAELLAHQDAPRTLRQWQEAMASTLVYYGIDTAEHPLDADYAKANKQHPHRRQFLFQLKNVRSRPNEITTQKMGQILQKLDPARFAAGMAHVVDWQGTSTEAIVAGFRDVTTLFGGRYRMVHAMRTVQMALCETVLVSEALDTTGEHMSTSNISKAQALFPPFYVSTLEHQKHFLFLMWDRLSASLGVDRRQGDAVISGMGQGDVECLLCETGGERKAKALKKIRGAMCALLTGGIRGCNPTNWREKAFKGHDVPSEAVEGVFVSTVFAANSLQRLQAL